jgi:phosphate transport system permease protein
VPSIIYGLLGLELFVRIMRPVTGGRSVLAGALTMALLVMPIVIIAAREALRAVATSQRTAAYALGATRWQVTSRVVVPAALPGILTGTILALSRAVGETAPLITMGALTYVAFLPDFSLAGPAEPVHGCCRSRSSTGSPGRSPASTSTPPPASSSPRSSSS